MATSAHRMGPGRAEPMMDSLREPRCADPRFIAFLASLERLLETPAPGMGKRVADQIHTLVGERDWLPEECCEPGDECYRRHVLYADPEGRFTVMAVVWRPGQGTPVHGHTAWGAVGVYRGNPSVDAYEYEEGGTPCLCATYHCCPGEVSHVEAGVESPHRVYNESDDVAITIHTYGRDLCEDPACINIVLSS